MSLSLPDNPSTEVTVKDKSYTIELVSASDNDATVKVTDEDGNTRTETISEAASKKMLGVEVSIDNADETNFQLSASVSVGSDRVTLQDGSAVKIGSDEDTIDGTNVEFELANATGASPPDIKKIVFQVVAKDSDNDAVFPGQSFVDPIFGSFKIDFAGITVPTDSTMREMIEVKTSGSDKMDVKFQSHDGTAPVTMNWAYNRTDSEATSAGNYVPGNGIDLADSGGDPIVVREMGAVNRSHYVVLASDDEGGLYEVTRIYNSSSTTASDDEITVKNVFSGTSTDAKATSEGAGTLTVQGRTYTFTYFGASTLAGEAMTARFNMPESAGQQMILFPNYKNKQRCESWIL
jgi:hypothetical protein